MSILYPEYMGEPKDWKPVRLRPVEEKFVRELEGVAMVAGVPRFRLVDATKATFNYDGDAELPRGTYLLYASMFNVQKQDGFVYPDGEGWKKVGRASEVPNGKIALPNYTYSDFGIPRYIVEVWRDKRDPGVEESGYVWAWTIDVKERREIAGEAVEISHYRHPSAFDIEHAKQFLSILEKATKESERRYAEKKAEARTKREAEQKEIRREEQAEATEKFIRDRLI